MLLKSQLNFISFRKKICIINFSPCSMHIHSLNIEKLKRKINDLKNHADTISIFF